MAALAQAPRSSAASGPAAPRSLGQPPLPRLPLAGRLTEPGQPHGSCGAAGPGGGGGEGGAAGAGPGRGAWQRREMAAPVSTKAAWKLRECPPLPPGPAPCRGRGGPGLPCRGRGGRPRSPGRSRGCCAAPSPEAALSARGGEHPPLCARCLPSGGAVTLSASPPRCSVVSRGLPGAGQKLREQAVLQTPSLRAGGLGPGVRLAGNGVVSWQRMELR